MITRCGCTVSERVEPGRVKSGFVRIVYVAFGEEIWFNWTSSVAMLAGVSWMVWCAGRRRTWFLMYCVVPYGAVVRCTMILCPVDAWAIVWRVGFRYVCVTGGSFCFY